MPTGIYSRNKLMSNLFQKGHTPWNKGKPHSVGHKFSKGDMPWNAGKKLHYEVWNKKNKLICKCILCFTQFEKVLSSKRKFCSRKCYGKYLKQIPSEKTSNWRGGIAKTWEKRNKEVKNFYTNRRRAIQRGNGGSFTKKEWDDLKKACQNTCRICGISEPEIKLTIDHIKPISKGGDSYITNIQPLCLVCNSRKNNKEIQSGTRKTLTK